MSASYFDVDGTLVRTNLIHPTLYYLRTQVNPVRSLKMLSRAFVRAPAMALAELRDRRIFNELLFSSLMMSIQSSTHSSQIKTVGPAISFLTSC